MPIEYKYKGFGSMARVELSNNHEGVKVYDEVFTETWESIDASRGMSAHLRYSDGNRILALSGNNAGR